MLGCTVLIIGATLQTASFGIPQLIVGRIITGLGNGVNTSTVPVWHSETTQATNRGRALAIELAINIFGVVRPQHEEVPIYMLISLDDRILDRLRHELCK